MEGIRSFIAIEIPASLRHLLENLQIDFKKAEVDVRWVRPEGIHLTLKFLGNIENSDVEKISQTLQSIATTWNPFELNFHGMGCFPGPRAPRVIWVGLNQGAECVRSLQHTLEENLAKEGFPREERSFTPPIGVALELHENQIPQFQEAVALASEPTVRSPASHPGALIDNNFRTGSAGSRVTHLPEVILAGEGDDPFRRKMPLPITASLLIRRDLKRAIAFVNRCPEPLRGQLENPG